MKNLLLSTALVLGLGTTAFATNVSISDVQSIDIFQQKEYKEIKPSEVNADALKKIGDKYAGYTLTGAAVAADGEYKLTLQKDGTTVVALFTSAGEFIKEA